MELIRDTCRGSHRIRRAKHFYARFRRSRFSPPMSCARSTAWRSRSSAKPIPTRRSRIHSTWFPTGLSAFTNNLCRKIVDDVRHEGAVAVVLLSHNGVDVDLKLAGRIRGIDAILGGHTHDPLPQAISVANDGGERWCQCRFATENSSGCWTSRLHGKRAECDYRLLPVFSESARSRSGNVRPDCAPEGAIPVTAGDENRRDGCTPLPARQFQRELRRTDPAGADAQPGGSDCAVARIPLGNHAASRRHGDAGRRDGANGNHLPVAEGRRTQWLGDQVNPWKTLRTICSIPIPTIARAGTWCVQGELPIHASQRPAWDIASSI